MARSDLSPADLFETLALEALGRVPWGTPVPSGGIGVYVVSLREGAADGSGLPSAPISRAALMAWVDRCPGLTVEGKPVGITSLEEHLSQWWLPNTSILYIGKADQPLSSRVGQYYRTPLGARSPHAGGYWLKTLSVLPDLWVHFAETDAGKSSAKVEDDLLNQFLGDYGPAPDSHPEPDLLLPWANLKVDSPRRRLRNHGLPSVAKQLRPAL